MKIYVALFREINVGGKNILPMKELASVLGDLGAQNIKTYIQSGNAVFVSPEKDTLRLANNISMNEELKQRFMQEVLPYLSAEDDTSFWITAFDTLLSDVEALYPEKSKKQEIFLQIGACSHWLRPHQKRWTASGGFAWPEGYLQKNQDHVKNSRGPIGGGLPELDWFVLAHWNREKKEWQLVAPKFFGKKRLVFRAALPTRTRRHRQAAIHTIWEPGSPEHPDKREVRLYGFRKRDQEWACVTTNRII